MKNTPALSPAAGAKGTVAAGRQRAAGLGRAGLSAAPSRFTQPQHPRDVSDHARRQTPPLGNHFPRKMSFFSCQPPQALTALGSRRHSEVTNSPRAADDGCTGSGSQGTNMTLKH